MSDPDRSRFERQFARIVRALPHPFDRHVLRLRHPSARWVRLPVGLLLIVAGVLGFLPVLGFWMIPLGLLVIAQDLPFLRRPMGRALVWMQDRWRRWKRRRRSR